MEDKIFQCRQCGFCCHGETTVSLNKKDVERLVSHLKMDFEAVSDKYLRITDNVIQMKTINGHCIFFNNGCTIHQGKPWRCTQWPLHPSMIADRGNYETIKESCPGIKKDLDYEEFRAKLQKLLDVKKREHQ